jgi:hypothetical protein
MTRGRPRKLSPVSAVARLAPELDHIISAGGTLANVLRSDFVRATLRNIERRGLRPVLATIFRRFMPAKEARAAARTLTPAPGRKTTRRKRSYYAKKPTMRSDLRRWRANHYGADGFAPQTRAGGER